MAIIPEKYTTLSPLQEEYRKFWQRFNELSLIHIEFSSTFKVHPIPSIRCYQDFAVGQPYHLFLKVNFKQNTFHVGAYFNNFPKFIEYHDIHKTRIESELGGELLWKQQTTAGSAERIFVADLFDKSKYDDICHRMMDEGLKLVSIFKKFSD